MKFFVDTIDVAAIRELYELGLVDGVTTNPSLIAHSGRDMVELVQEIAEAVDGPVSAGVVATDHETMIAEGRRLAEISGNVAVKLPLTLDGLRACRVLSDEGFMVNVTLCFSAGQALLAAKAGATFVSPFVGRLDDMSGDGLALVSEIRTIYDNYGYETQILAASIRSPAQMAECALIGADAATAPPAVVRAMAGHVLTEQGLATFVADADRAGLRIL